MKFSSANKKRKRVFGWWRAALEPSSSQRVENIYRRCCCCHVLTGFLSSSSADYIVCAYCFGVRWAEGILSTDKRAQRLKRIVHLGWGKRLGTQLNYGHVVSSPPPSLLYRIKTGGNGLDSSPFCFLFFPFGLMMGLQANVFMSRKMYIEYLYKKKKKNSVTVWVYSSLGLFGSAVTLKWEKKRITDIIGNGHDGMNAVKV